MTETPTLDGFYALIALNRKANRTGAPIFAGIQHATKAKRRAAGKVAKASRKTNRAR